MLLLSLLSSLICSFILLRILDKKIDGNVALKHEFIRHDCDKELVEFEVMEEPMESLFTLKGRVRHRILTLKIPGKLVEMFTFD